MDVHPPHEPIHSVRDFLLHLFTITVGLLIALSLEKAVEHFHNRHLVHEAEASLRSELTENQKEIEGTLPFYTRQMGENNKMLDVLHKVGDQKNANISFAGVTLDEASYATAQNDGACSHALRREREDCGRIRSPAIVSAGAGLDCGHCRSAHRLTLFAWSGPGQDERLAGGSHGRYAPGLQRSSIRASIGSETDE